MAELESIGGELYANGKRVLTTSTPNKNLLINGNFSVWQRGEDFSSGGYTADRWQGYIEGTEGKVYRYEKRNQLVMLAITDVTNIAIYQRIEHQVVENLEGESVTFSFYIFSDGAAKDTEFYIELVTPDAKDDWSSGTSFEAKYILIPMGLSDERFSVTFDNLPSSVANGLQVNVGTTDSPNNNDQWGFERVQLERGSIATEFEYRHIALEQSLCDRYYEKMYTYSKFLSPNDDSLSRYLSIYFRNQMRINPAVTADDDSNGNPVVLQAISPDKVEITTEVTDPSYGVSVGDYLYADAEL